MTAVVMGDRCRATSTSTCAIENELRERYGQAFRLDVTRTENVWGPIILRDIEASPTVTTLDGVPLRALRVEDLFLLKLLAARPRDVADLDLRRWRCGGTCSERRRHRRSPSRARPTRIETARRGCAPGWSRA